MIIIFSPKSFNEGISYISQNVKHFATLAAEADRLHFLMVVLEDLSHIDTLTDMTSSSSSHEEVMWEEEEPRYSLNLE